MRGLSSPAAVPAGLHDATPPGREPERWRTQGATVKRRLESWAEILAETHLAFDVGQTAHTPVDFEGAVMRRRIGDLMLVDCAASPFLGSRGRAMIAPSVAAGNENILGFQFVCRGVELVREASRDVALTPGDVVLWDGLQPTEVEIIEPFYKRTLMFPRHEVLALCPRLADADALPALSRNGPAHLLVRYMNALALELPQLETAARAAAASAALELLRAVIEPSLPTNRAAGRAALRADVRRYVRAHLQDPALGPVSIARQYSISVRALHALFEDADASVAALVRGERLARCLEDLRRVNGGSVTEIAFRWGFCDAAHFSRVFKREYGATPSEIRHAAIAAQTSAGD
ncbi:MAG TPA: helix-turn-helix domain-containing protein [Solirubrobacteraceae bacterium]|nr:helix-turn-helix domain-containing protein [Solirubrobacteraceae bacterium]